MIVVLIHVNLSVDWDVEERVLMMKDREEARNYCGKVASGDRSDVKIHKIIEVDTRSERVQELELKLVGFELKLVEKKDGAEA